jgi:hypothetical protein
LKVENDRKMKRLLYFALAAALLISCDKNDETAPSIAWPSNTKFAQVEMGTGFDSVISVNAPGKIESLTLTLGLGDYAMVANSYISLDANKGTSNKYPTLDVIDDAKSAAFLSSLGMSAGPGLRGGTIGTLKLEPILEALLKDQIVKNDSKYTIDIRLLDQSGKSVTEKATFHYTAPPTIAWADKVEEEFINLNNYSPSKPGPSKIRISAPGKIRDLTVSLEYGADAALAKYVQNRTTGNVLVIDLINDPLAEDSFKFPSAKVLSGKTDAELSFSFIYGLIPDLSASTNIFTVKVVDTNGKPCSFQLKFTK